MVRCEILQHYQLACTHVCTHSLDRSNLFYSTRGLKKNQKFRKKPYLIGPQCCIVPCTHILNYPHTGVNIRQDKTSCCEVWDVRMCEAGRSACVLIVFHVEGGRFWVLVHVCIYMWLEDVMLERSAHGAIPWL